MGEPTTTVHNVSAAVRDANGFITDGKFLKFGSPYPQSSTDLKGAELAVDFQKGEKKPGQLALVYYYGRADDHFTEDDLPLGDNPLVEFIRFSAQREAKSHFLLSEWRWPVVSPVFQSKHFRLVQPQYSLGVGGMYINTRVVQDGDAKQVSKRAAFVTSAMQLRIAEVAVGPVSLSFETSLRMIAGQTYGIMAEYGLRLSYSR